MTRNLAARIERLEAAKRSPSKIIGILNYCDSQNWPAWKGEGPFIGVIGGVRFKPGEFEGRCLLQQQSLMADVARYAAQLGEETNEADAQAPGIVGTAAPLKPGMKRQRFFEAHGREIDAFTLTRN